MTLKNYLRKTVEDHIPDEEHCLDNEEECFDKHPIHGGGWSNGRLELVYADVDGMLDILVQAVKAYVTTHDILTESDQ